jgi:2-aminoadipate transaminase
MADETISFARGAPSADLLPADAVREAAARALDDDWKTALSYGKGAGHPGLREWIAERHGVGAEQVMVTNGSLEAGVMLFEHLVEPGDRVVVEQPSYDRTLLQLKRLEAELVPVPLEDDGIELGALEAAVGDGAAPKLAHLIPHFQNPAGCTLSVEKRPRIAALAAERGFTIFEDDPYFELGFEGGHLATMLSLDEADRVVFASSFSKTVSPGVRVGYLVGPEETIGELTKKAGDLYISPNMLAESVVCELCRSGALQQNIESVRVALKERCDALCAALDEHIPEAEFVIPAGGYFLWLSLAEDVDAHELLAAATEEGATFIAGPAFMLEGGANSLRLCFASVPAEQIPEGVRRIAAALERLRARAAA